MGFFRDSTDGNFRFRSFDDGSVELLAIKSGKNVWRFKLHMPLNEFKDMLDFGFNLMSDPRLEEPREPLP